MIMTEGAQSAAASGTEQESEPIVYINGKLHKLPLGRAEVTLLAYLRGKRAFLRRGCCMSVKGMTRLCFACSCSDKRTDTQRAPCE